jgi:NTE family protein
MRTRHYVVGLSAVLLVVCGASLSCFSPPNNPLPDRLPPAAPTKPADAEAPGQDPQTLFFVAFSGGGTRAAAMSWAVLEELRKIPYHYEWPEGTLVESTLADEIDYVSGISGGAFAASAWCLFKDDPQRMAAFREGFIERNIQGALAKGIFWPAWRPLQLLSPHFDRIHVAADLYESEVFHDPVTGTPLTFGDVPAHPELWLNATNLGLGDRFTFKRRDDAKSIQDDDFSLIGSDIMTFSIGKACAASSAFPVLLSPITLGNLGEQEDLLATDIRYEDRMTDARDFLDIKAASYVQKRDFYNDKEKHPYIHLADGGLVDNQGLQAILDQFTAGGVVYKRINNSTPVLKRLIVINVNAGVQSEDEASSKANAPGVGAVLAYATVLSMDVLSMKRWAELSNALDYLRGVSQDLAEQKSFQELEKTPPFAIEIAFRNLQDEKDRRKALDLPTTFALDDGQLSLIRSSVTELTQRNPELNRLRKSLNASCREAGCEHPPIPVSEP